MPPRPSKPHAASLRIKANRVFYAPDGDPSVEGGLPVADIWGLGDYGGNHHGMRTLGFPGAGVWTSATVLAALKRVGFDGLCSVHCKFGPGGTPWKDVGVAEKRSAQSVLLSER